MSTKALEFTSPDKGPRGSLFKLFKPGQGYWTRLGTAMGAGAIILFIAWFVFNETKVFSVLGSSGRRYALAAGVAAMLSLLAWWLMNAPKRAQFMIDTDSELKKVNWSGWGELVGSTRIVVFFMLAIALMLFILDTQFHAFFYSVRVWHIEFAGMAGLMTGALLVFVLLAVSFGLLRGGAEVTGRSRTAGVVCLAAGLVVAAAWTWYAIRSPGLFNLG
jgi:preprotein translocase subunit SecE